MKQSEFRNCALCGKGMAAGGVHFYRVQVEQLVLNTTAITRQHGLEQMMGSPALAQALGPDEDLAVAIGDPVESLICGDCGMGNIVPVAILMEGRE